MIKSLKEEITEDKISLVKYKTCIYGIKAFVH